MYGDGDAEHLAALAGVDVHQSKEYALIDAELQARGMGVLARKKRQGLKGALFGKYYYGEDTAVSAKQTKEEQSAEVENLRKANEERRRKKAAAEAAAEAARNAELQKKLD